MPKPRKVGAPVKFPDAVLTGVRLPGKQFTALKIKAKLNGQTVSDFIRAALDKALA